MAGILKATLGILGYASIGHCGIRSCLYGRKHLKRYYESEIRKYPVQHDSDGCPVHPKT